MQNRANKFNQQQIFIFIAASIVLILVIGYFGISFLFGLTTQISNFQRQNNGNTSQVDSGLAPNTPRLSQDFFATSSADIKVSGAADPKVNVELFQNDRSLGSNLSSEQGEFTFEVSLEKGANIFIAQSVSEKGAKSEKSESYTISFITGSPKLDLNTPTDGSTVKESPIVVSGKTDSGNSVSINDHIIVVSDDGSFSDYLNLNDGENKVKIVASDPAGNKTTTEMTIKLEK